MASTSTYSGVHLRGDIPPPSPPAIDDVLDVLPIAVSPPPPSLHQTFIDPLLHRTVITPPPPINPEACITPDSNLTFTHGQDIPEDVVPLIGTMFESEDAAYSFYNRYARYAGFGIKKGKFDNARRARFLHCTRQGNHTYKGEELACYCKKAENKVEENSDDVNKLLMFFKEMKVKNNNFYFDIQADEKDAIQNIFWCNASSRAAYHHFGDCITFDTTYRTNMFNMPLAVFVGCNHHMQSVILSVALLRDERAESFEWLFKTFLKCMGGKAPMCILTDEDPAMASAIREVLKNTIHRLCRWHVLKKYKKQLGVLYEMFKHRNFKEKLHFVINHPLTPSEFVAAWKDLVEEFELQGCECEPVLSTRYAFEEQLSKLYTRAVFTLFKETLFDSTAFLVNEVSNAMGAYVVTHGKTIRKNPWSQHAFQVTADVESGLYECECKTWIHTELSLHCNKQCLLLQLQCEPVLSTRYAFEEQLSKLYTRAVFTLFKETLFDSTAFLVNEVSNAMGAYVVTHGKTIRKNPWSQHAFQVTADVESGLYECECKTWIHTGLFCPHIVRVLSHLQVEKILPRYILKRYTRSAKEGGVFDDHDYRRFGLDSTSEIYRHTVLINEATKVAKKASKSTQCYDRAMEVFKELDIEIDGIPCEQLLNNEENNIGEMETDPVQAPLTAPPISTTKGRKKDKEKLVSKQTESKQRKDHSRRCSVCHKIEGHNARTCPSRSKRQKTTTRQARDDYDEEDEEDEEE
ncbi:hypothetical protein OsJ_33607 [Oryza sativa Japonica Group]|uniref:Protein FAR1-RELATED SEQUENCE n=1 Tax=Oryza sativa subsp. japonica TaxID=39947 RepID=B9GAA2_ORYSJ|nr:hypothetical protein OsJ_33607 [Oryza sativa Japonica Group]